METETRLPRLKYIIAFSQGSVCHMKVQKDIRRWVWHVIVSPDHGVRKGLEMKSRHRVLSVVGPTGELR